MLGTYIHTYNGVTERLQHTYVLRTALLWAGPIFERDHLWARPVFVICLHTRCLLVVKKVNQVFSLR